MKDAIYLSIRSSWVICIVYDLYIVFIARIPVIFNSTLFTKKKWMDKTCRVAPVVKVHK